jgi:hypothetical protein
MATDYGSDIKALDDLPDPEEIATGEENLAYAQARRVIQDPGAFDEIGETEEYVCVDIRSALGGRLDETERATLEESCSQALNDDERIESAAADVAFTTDGLQLSSSHEGANGPFGLVVAAGTDGVTASLLKGG